MKKIGNYLKGLKVETVVLYLVILIVCIYAINKTVTVVKKNRRSKELEKKIDVKELRDPAQIKALAVWFYEFFNPGFFGSIINYFKENDVVERYETVVHTFTDDEIRRLSADYALTEDEKTLHQRAERFEVSFFNEDEKKAFLSRLERLGLN